MDAAQPSSDDHTGPSANAPQHEPHPTEAEPTRVATPLPGRPAKPIPRPPTLQPVRKAEWRPKRNDPCWCGSGKKYKQCHLQRDQG
jgi:uncharacterized protein YecA (UPF0149 family)